jgi:hypothetical protein
MLTAPASASAIPAAHLVVLFIMCPLSRIATNDRDNPPADPYQGRQLLMEKKPEFPDFEALTAAFSTSGLRFKAACTLSSQKTCWIAKD